MIIANGHVDFFLLNVLGIFHKLVAC